MKVCACYIPLLTILASSMAMAKTKDSIDVYCDYSQIHKDKLVLWINYVSDLSFKGSLSVKSFLYNKPTDSQLVFERRSDLIRIKQGVGKFRVYINPEDSNGSAAQPYFHLLKYCGTVPPGIYKTYITITDASARRVFYKTIYREVDSNLSGKSPLRDDINRVLTSRKAAFIPVTPSRSGFSKFKHLNSGTVVSNKLKKINQNTQAKGLNQIAYKVNNTAIIDLFYSGWFAGRYKVDDTKPLSDHLAGEEKLHNTFAIDNELDFHPSIASQFQNENKKMDKYIKGDVSYSVNAANDQEQYSGVNNNYYEVKGSLQIPLGPLPMQLEGLYTSQDKGRKTKSSYFRVHYDVQSLKDELQQQITAYNQKFRETQSKMTGMESIYQSSINNLQGQRNKLTSELPVAPLTTPVIDPLPTNDIAINNVAATSVQKGDTTHENGSKNQKENIAANSKNEYEQKRQKIEELDAKIAHYQSLLAQYSNTNYFDSALAYGQTKDISDRGSLSYKELVKRADGLLPEGTSRKLTTGLTSFDAGVYNKYASSYTISGQQMKGVDVAYDLGFCEIGGGAGKTEYISRDGTLDKYTFYTARTSYTRIADQKITFIYYGYTPDRKMISGDGFFSNLTLSSPTFSQPVHILSGNYEGKIARLFNISAEVASSFKKQLSSEGRSATAGNDNMAYHVSVDGAVPKTTLRVMANAEKTGNDFENQTLPLNLKGAERYKLGTSTDLFRSLLTVGVDFNYFLQHNSSSRVVSTKWGFDGKTHFKRYPNLSVSYKPFTTFRYFTDTLDIPQRPVAGSVLTGKVFYKLKKDGRTYNFSLMGSRNATIMDTSNYSSALLQLVCIYNFKGLVASGTIGRSQQSAAANLYTPATMNFCNLSAAYPVSPRSNLTAAQEVGVYKAGLCRYATTLGWGFTPKKSAVSVRTLLRYNTYQPNPGETWKQIYSGNLEVAYSFKQKIIPNNNR